ncbi:MFS transporter [Actinacidiphila glaucinigra]|uniref:MFS transporter n=1 Tax=Actinacidiphila glaucinigra TaxID=235986 RepID=UPI002DD8506A|nr:MFS transporter [Actinacidiphila glaucinigra]
MVLAHHHCARLLFASVAGRLPLGMAPITLLLLATREGLPLPAASLLAGVYGVAPAVGLPLLGRISDVHGLLWPCLAGAALVTTALGTLALVGTASLWLAVGCAALAGAGCPPLEGAQRSLWPTVLPDTAHVRTAIALDSATQEVVYVAGPALAIATVTWLSPAAALTVAAVMTALGTAVFMSTPPARIWRGSPTRRPDRLGALRPRGMRPVLIAMVFLGATAGALDVAAITAAGRSQAAWLAGGIPAAFSAAGICGAALFARLPARTTRRGVRQLFAPAAVFTACWIPLLTPAPPLLILALVVLPGAVFVALLTASSLAVAALAPPGTSTEATGWMTSALRLGTAGGTALAGPLTGSFAVPLAAAAVCALLLAIRPDQAPNQRPASPAHPDLLRKA